MNFKDMLPKGLQDAIFEDEPQPDHAKPVTAVPAGNPLLAGTGIAWPGALATKMPTISPGPEIAGDAASSINAFAQMLKDKTDFDNTPVGQQVKEELMPLEGLPLNETQQMTAVLKAGAKQGLTGQKIVSTLQGLIADLEKENKAFQTTVAAARVKEVDARTEAIQAEADRLKDLESQIALSRQKQGSLSNELITAQSNIQRKEAQFKAAYDARLGELQTSITHYQTILQGLA